MPDAGIFTVVIGFLREIGQWGVAPLAALVLLSPPLMCMAVLWFGVRSLRSLEKTMVEGMAEVRILAQAMSDKYDNNVILVEESQRLARDVQRQNDAILQVVKENTAAITLLSERLAGMKGGQ